MIDITDDNDAFLVRVKTRTATVTIDALEFHAAARDLGSDDGTAEYVKKTSRMVSSLARSVVVDDDGGGVSPTDAELYAVAIKVLDRIDELGNAPRRLRDSQPPMGKSPGDGADSNATS